MDEIIIAYRRILYHITLSLFVISLVACIIAAAAPTIDKLLSKFKMLGKAHKFVCLFFTFCCIAYGGAKAIFRFDGGIKQSQSPVATNDTVIIYWQRDTSGGVYVPESAAVYIDYRLSTDTNGEWTLLAETTVGAWGWSGTLQNATNYVYNVWAYYIPPEPVHTNGVWTYKTMRDRREKYIIPIRARTEVDGKAIATPKEVRKDEEAE